MWGDDGGEVRVWALAHTRAYTLAHAHVPSKSPAVPMSLRALVLAGQPSSKAPVPLVPTPLVQGW